MPKRGSEPSYANYKGPTPSSLLLDVARDDTWRPPPEHQCGRTWRGSGECSSTNYSMVSGYEDSDAKQDED